jgi:biopolymer transport protein ExbD
MAGGGSGGTVGKVSRSQRKITSKAKSRNATSGGLMLTSMLDILTVILFFLLKIYSSSVTDFAAAKDITLPRSSSLIPPAAALKLVVTREAVILDEQPVVTITNGDVDKKELYRDGVTIVKLAQLLKQQKERSMFQSQSNDPHSFSGTIVLQADKDLSFNLLKKVIYTAGISDFVMLKLAVLKKDAG